MTLGYRGNQKQGGGLGRTACWAVGAALGIAACISPEREALQDTAVAETTLPSDVDTTDDTRPPSPDTHDTTTGPDDTLVEPDDTLVEPDDTLVEPDDTLVEPDDTLVEPDDTLVEPDDTLVEPDDTLVEPDTTPACNEDADCQDMPLRACEWAKCAGGSCQAAMANDNVPCDDGDPCTVGDTCSQGQCQGSPMQCFSDSPCYAGACDPTSGACISTAVKAGTPCDNGSGPAVGSCQNWFLVGEDSCDGEGTCVDSSAAAGTGPKLIGDWYFVVSSVNDDGPLDTKRGFFALSSTGGWGSWDVSSSDPSVTAIGPGTYCEDPQGLFRAATPTGNYVGQAAMVQPVITLGAPANKQVGLAVRVGGERSDVYGRYTWVSTAARSVSNSQVDLQTWRGELNFVDGCLDQTTQFSSTPSLNDGVWEIIPGQSDCLTIDGDLVELALNVRVVGQDTGFLLTWRGAIAPGGDVLVLTRDDGNPTPAYGTIIALRQAPTPVNAVLQGPWFFTSHLQTATPSTEYGFEIGWQGMAADGSIGAGEFSDLSLTSVAIHGDWTYLESPGRFAQRRRTSTPVGYAGWVTPTRDFAMAWISTDNTSQPGPLSLDPARGSLILLTARGTQ